MLSNYSLCVGERLCRLVFHFLAAKDVGIYWLVVTDNYREYVWNLATLYKKPNKEQEW